MEQKNNIPQIRFKGFLEEWEERKLETIGNTFVGLFGKTKEDFGHGEARFITYMNVFSNTISSMKGTERIEIDNKQNQVRYGDILFTTSSETPEEVGMSSIWLENEENVYLNSFCFGFRPNIKSDPYYMGYMLRSKSFRNNVILLAQGISRYNLSKNAVMNIGINLPNLEEQQYIGKLFNNIDKTINLYKHKHEKLVSVKKIFLQKMFPKNGKNIPEIRFKEFTKAWEQRTFEEIFNYERPDKYIVKSDKYNENSKTPVLTANKAFILGYTDETNTYENEKESIIFDDFTIDSKFVNFPYMVKSSAIKILTLKNKSTDNLRFNYELLNSTKFEILGHARHYISVVQPKQVYTTSKPEQNKIALILAKMDNLTKLYESKIEKLENVKRELLEKMFV